MDEKYSLPPDLVDGFQKLVSGDFSHRLPRNLKRDEQDTVAFFFNTMAEELERIIRTAQASEQRLNNAIEAISAALVQVASGNLEIEVERDYKGDQLDVLAYLVNTTVSELNLLVTENQRRNEEIQARLESAVKERTRQLFQSEQNFRLLFETAPVPVLLIDVADKIVHMYNEAAAAILEIPPEQLAGQPLPDFFQSVEDREMFFANLSAGNRIENYSLPISTASGATVWVLMNTRPVIFSGKAAMMLSFADLTKEREATLQLEAAYQHELEIARQLQVGLLPSQIFDIPGLDMATFFQPAQQVGGDLYNFFVFDSEHVGIAIGDASGKGLQAALMMSLSVGIVSSHVDRDVDPAALLGTMNPKIWSHTQRSKVNMAFCYQTLARTNNGWVMRVANAGGMTPLLVRQRENRSEWIDVGGLPLGVVMNAHYWEHQQALMADDIIIMSSDGIVEAMNRSREVYGFERLQARAHRAPSLTAHEIQDWILDDIREFVGTAEQHDDMTLVIVVVGQD